MGLSPLVGLLQSLQIVMFVILAHPLKKLKTTEKFSRAGKIAATTVRGEIAKNPKKKKNNAIFSYLLLT